MFHMKKTVDDLIIKYVDLHNKAVKEYKKIPPLENDHYINLKRIYDKDKILTKINSYMNIIIDLCKLRNGNFSVIYECEQGIYKIVNLSDMDIK